MANEHDAQSGAAVRSSELVVLLARWNENVIMWEQCAQSALATNEPDVRERSLARANEIARCRRELEEVVKQHNEKLSD